MLTKTPWNRLISLTLAVGALGGAGLALANRFLTPGKGILLPFALLVLAIVIVLRGERIAGYRTRFLVGFAAFTLSSLILYADVVIAVGSDVGVLGHLWRLAFVVALSVAVNLPAARVSAPPAFATS